MSNFAEATLTPLPTDVQGIRDRDNEDWHDSIAGDDVGGDELSASTTLTKAEALQAKGMMGWEEDDISFLPIPKFGGIMKMARNDSADGKVEYLAWSGTDPESTTMTYSWDIAIKSWYYPCTLYDENFAKIRGPTRNRMYRPQGVKSERKTAELCATFTGEQFSGLNPKDGKINMPMKTFKERVRAHCIETGMWDIFNLSDPKMPNKKWDLFRFHAMLPLSQVLKEVTRFHDCKDMYINQNLKWSGEYIRSSISSELLEKLLQDSSISDSGPEAFAALMRVIHSDSYEALETTKKTLEDIKLKSYPGENIRKCNEDIGRLAEQLQSGGHFNNELLCKIAQIYEGSSDAKFSQWATINLYDKVVQQVKELRVIDKSALDEK